MSSWNSLDNKHLRGRDRGFFAPSEPYEVRTLRDHLKGEFPEEHDDRIDKAISFVATRMTAAISQDHAKAVTAMFLAKGPFRALEYVYANDLAK